MALPKPPVISFANLPDEELIKDFINSPLTTAKSLLRQPDQKQRFWQLLEKYPNNQQLSKAYHKVEQILGVIPTFQPQTQTQSAPTATTQTIPTITTKEFVQPKTEEKEIGPENAKGIQDWMNGIKPGFYKYLAEKKFDAATSQRMFTNSFLEYLSMYKGGLAGFYLSQGSHELIYSALGPIGDALASLHQKDLQWKVKWMKNPLNPNALYYYLNVLPEEAAFKLLYHPVKATWAILAKGGAPLITKTTYRESSHRDYGQIKTGYFFSPTLKLGQAANAFADGLDKLTGIPTNNNYFRLDQSQPSPFDQFIQKKNHDFKTALDDLKQAKSGKSKAEIREARIKLKNLLDEHDGFYRYFLDKKTGQLRNVSELSLRRRAAFISAGVSRAIFGKILRNTARRLRQQHNDPITYLLSLIGGALWDMSAGFVLNAAKVLVTKIVNAIPGLNTIRAQLTEFFTSNRYLSTARMGGTTLQSFGKALVSPTSFSSGYLGASAGGWIANALGLPVLPGQVIGGGIGYGLGTFYRASLNMAMNPTSLNWIYRYNELLLKATDINLSVTEQNYWRSQLEKEFLRVYPDSFKSVNFRPGPFSNFAKWLYENPYARLPVNGWVVGDIAAKIFGWNPWVGRISFAAADWVWQTRGAWGSTIARWLPTTRLGLWVSNKVISAQTWVLKNFIVEQVGTLGNLPQWGIRPFWRFMQNAWSKIQPYAANIFNPGFFLGFNLIPLLTPSLGAWAFVAGPIVGSSAWLLGTRVISAVVGMPFGQFSAMFNPLAYTGFFIGQISGLFIFGFNVPLWYTMAWTIGLPTLGIGLQSLAWSLGYSSATYLLGSAISSITGGLISSLAATTAMASAIAAWATFMSVATILGLTVFSLFVITSALWTPMQALHNAGPTSNYFNIQTNAVCPPNSSTCRFCSNFSVSQPLLNQNSYLEHQFDFANTNLTVDLTDPKQTITVSRNSTPLQYNPNYGPNLTPSTDFTTDYGVLLPLAEPFFVGGQQPGGELLTSYLSSRNALKANLFDQIKEHSELSSIIAPVLDILQKLAQDSQNSTRYYLDELEATNALFREQKFLTNFPEYFKTLSQAQLQEDLNYYLTNNPLTKPVNTCAADDQRCQRHFQAMQGIYNSWADPFNQLLYYVNNPSENNQAAVETLVADFVQQADMQQNIYNKLENISIVFPDCIDSMTNSPCQEQYQKLSLLATANINNISNLPLVDQQTLWDFLKQYFGDIFNNTEYYYFPQGSNYQVCAEAEYCSPSLFPDGCSTDPQTVCSIIHAQQGNWWYASATEFAKQCTTFTPSVASPAPPNSINTF